MRKCVEVVVYMEYVYCGKNLNRLNNLLLNRCFVFSSNAERSGG